MKPIMAGKLTESTYFINTKRNKALIIQSKWSEIGHKNKLMINTKCQSGDNIWGLWQSNSLENQTREQLHCSAV